jgi:hypothetical protein
VTSIGMARLARPREAMAMKTFSQSGPLSAGAKLCAEDKEVRSRSVDRVNSSRVLVDCQLECPFARCSSALSMSFQTSASVRSILGRAGRLITGEGCLVSGVTRSGSVG